jgi:hypothetical protein
MRKGLILKVIILVTEQFGLFNKNHLYIFKSITYKFELLTREPKIDNWQYLRNNYGAIE